MLASRKKIAFIMYHGTGHFNACFDLARKFKVQHDVIFVGVEFFKRYIEGQGFQYYSLKTVPFGLNLENWVNEIAKKKFIWWHTLKDRWRDRLYYMREAELKKFLTEFNPDYILIDSLQSTDFIVLYPHIQNTPVRVGFINATYPLNLKYNDPPINSLALPDDPKAIVRAHLIVRWNRWWKSVTQKFRYAGMDDHRIISRRIKQNQIPVQYLFKDRGLFSTTFQNITEFFVVPKEFDFPTAYPANQYFLGLQIDHARQETTHPEFYQKKEFIYQQVSARQSKLIYCAFGTVPLKDKSPVIKLLQKIVEVTQQLKHTLIVSFPASTEEVTELTHEHDHVFIFNSLPQLEILSKADAFITHGGLNSIKESIDAGVPMLIYLMEAKRDQKGNAARILYHKIGKLGDLKNDSPDDIQSHLNVLLKDPDMKSRILKLKHGEYFSSDRVLEILDSAALT